MRGSSGLRARVSRRHRGRCAAIRVFERFRVSGRRLGSGGKVKAVRVRVLNRLGFLEGETGVGPRVLGLVG